MEKETNNVPGNFLVLGTEVKSAKKSVNSNFSLTFKEEPKGKMLIPMTLSLWEEKGIKRKGCFSLVVKDKTKSSLIFTIHHDPKWVSWKYTYSFVNIDIIKENWEKIRVLLSIVPSVNNGSLEIILLHLIAGFENRNKNLFSTKFDVCTDIYNYLCEKRKIPLKNIESVCSLGENTPTVAW